MRLPLITLIRRKEMKKLFGAILAAAMLLSSMAVTCSALDERDRVADATFSFDTDAGISKWEVFGSAANAGLTMKTSDARSIKGRSLAVSESFTESLNSKFGGIRITSDIFDLDSFEGCRISMSVYVEPGASEHANELKLFSDGKVWIEKSIDINSQQWTEYSVSVPTGTSNNTFGISIPIADGYDGVVCFIDEVKVYDPSGAMIGNVGDFSLEEVVQAQKGTSSFAFVMMIIAFVVLILGFVAGGAFLITKLIARYR